MKIGVIVVLAILLSACVRTPTESTQVVDDRPRVAFEPINLQDNLSSYEVIIDNRNYGKISQYLVNQNVLPIIAGRHLIEVHKSGISVFRQEVVLGENTTRIIKVTE